ncbi:MAG TPA: TAT-variant-translocated molybdopterin oxidoreductase [Vicinamibacterales bacterium]|nr:TAT-variant-translocated molybdopterin oxidoreductase [Vicinamibacterales bacterium]
MHTEGTAVGPDFWRTLEERAGDPAFHALLENEFAAPVEAVTDPVARRTFLKLMGASLALAGVTGCTRQPLEKIVPYVRQPEELIPGRPLFFATAMPLGGVATGLVVESHEGRPTKIEGNPKHPGSLGATDVFAQAAILGLYDPSRSQTVTNLGDIVPWATFQEAIRAELAAHAPRQGAGLRILTESVNSPTLAAQIRELLTRFPSAKWHQWDPASRESARTGATLAFGQYVDAVLHIDRADIVLALDADFLASGPGSLAYARQFAARRKPGSANRMNRLYAVEAMPTSTGSRADHRLAVRPSQVEDIARQIAGGIRSPQTNRPISTQPASPEPPGRSQDEARWIRAVIADLLATRGRSLVIAGDTQPPQVHVLAHVMNEALGNTGHTVDYIDPVEAEPINQLDSMHALIADMNDGHVDLLVIIGGNPVYTVPADLSFAAAMSNVPHRVHMGAYHDETAALCQWHIPESHFLESWSDSRAYDGSVAIVQPLIAPLYSSKSAHELLIAMSDKPERSAYEVVREFWNVQEDETTWRHWLHEGTVPQTAFAARSMAVRRDAPQSRAAASRADGTFEIAFKHDPSVLDGRFANNGWLQELPKPITRLTWDNAVMLSPATAARLGVGGRPSFQGGEHGQITSDVVDVRHRGRSVRGAVFTVVGHPDDCVTLHLGYGRTRAGHVGTGTGFDANRVRASDAPWFDSGVEIVRTGEVYPLACTQYHHLIEGRGAVRAVTRDVYLQNPASIRDKETPPRTITLYPDHEYKGYKWGMAIDLNTCIGCNACVVGCQAENNIPVIGKDQVLRGREMHWLRIDTYYSGEVPHPETYFQPVPCMQCENAPCEVVCPVGATVHSHEGLNDMVYNRCVGTRYCSNNCPYKVRRFNFLLYQDWDTPILKLGRNPDVTVRSRGVMEKCTYCVQRINAAKIAAETDNRTVEDGDVTPACQQACPAEAIVFGDLNDPRSRVATLKAEERNYSLLGELNTRPRTTYLAAVRNPNPQVGPGN